MFKYLKNWRQRSSANKPRALDLDLERGNAALLQSLVKNSHIDDSVNSSDPSSSIFSIPSLQDNIQTLTYVNPAAHIHLDSGLQMNINTFLATLFTQLTEQEQLFCRDLIA